MTDDEHDDDEGNETQDEAENEDDLEEAFHGLLMYQAAQDVLTLSRLYCVSNWKIMATYYLTIKAGDEIVRARVPFADYAEALEACGEFYDPRGVGGVLRFTSEVTGKKFKRSFAQLTLLSDVPPNSRQAFLAIKQSNSFYFSKSYTFLVESDVGVRESERWAREDEKDE